MSRTPRNAAARPSPPLGSLTQKGARDGVVCSACSSPSVTRIEVRLTDGTPADLTSCHRCEHRTWTTTGGDLLSKESVLNRARKPV